MQQDAGGHLSDYSSDEHRFPRAETVADFTQNLTAVRSTIEAAAARAGRSASDIRLLPVSKTVPEERIRLAAQAGCQMLGENKVQEADGKQQNLADLNLRWSVIGHLQSNKAKDVARFADEFQALDRLKVAEALDRRLQAAGRSLDIFVQVNTSGEKSKFGLAPDEVEAFLHALPVYSSLKVKGLMTLAVFSAETERVRQCFSLLRSIRDRALQSETELIGDAELSMGMSGDFETAIEEGSTVVRVGQSIFGPRPLPNSHYWPSPIRGERDDT